MQPFISVAIVIRQGRHNLTAVAVSDLTDYFSSSSLTFLYQTLWP